MKPDPDLAYFGHPILPCGYNSWENDGDDVDGPGVNEPIWPYLYGTFVALTPLIISAEMLEVFETECPDYVAAKDVWETSPSPPDNQIFFGADSWGTQVIPWQSNTLTLPYQRREVAFQPDWRDRDVRGMSDTTLLTRDQRNQIVRKRR